MLRQHGPRVWLAGFVLLAIAPSVYAEDSQPNVSASNFDWQLDQSAQQSLITTELASESDILLTAGSCDCGSDCGCGDCVDSGCCGCTAKKKKKVSPCAKSHKVVFYANDFSYLNDPCYKGHCLGDCLKLNPVGQCGRWGTLDVGGQLRVRYHHEQGMGQDLSGAGTRRFENTNHDFVLTRLRLYTNWQVNDMVRFYTEGIFADASDDEGTYQHRGIDRNYGDLLNAFVDLKLTDNTTVRVGRQELLYGNQRLVSPLDWANTRRTFEGVRGLWKDGDLAVDVFYTNFVPVVANDFDEADYNQSFYGIYGTCTAWENATLECYYLGYDDERQGALNRDFSLHTVGARLYGTVDGWMYEVEGGPQFGRQSGLGRDHDAAFATAGIGRKMPDHRWTPTLWFFYDYASGDDGSGGGSYNGFNQLFPLAHKYFGFIDAVQRSNVEAPNILLKMTPCEKVQLLAWYWHFMANQEGTPVPSIGGQPTQNTTSSKDLGDELDLIAKYKFGPHSNALIGYSHFWRGNKITAPDDADFVYVQWTTDF